MNYRVHHLTGSTGGSGKIDQDRQRGFLNKRVSLLGSGFDDIPWLWERAFTPPTDHFFSDSVHRIIIRTAACKTAHFHFICQIRYSFLVYVSHPKLYTPYVCLVYSLRNFSSSFSSHLVESSISKSVKSEIHTPDLLHFGLYESTIS